MTILQEDPVTTLLAFIKKLQCLFPLPLAHTYVAERALGFGNPELFAQVFDPGRGVDPRKQDEEGRRLRGRFLVRRGHVEGRLFDVFLC